MGDAAPGMDRLTAFLRDQRWFGEKGREIRSAEITTSIPVRWPGVDRQYAVARATVTTDAGTSHYQLFLTDGDASLHDALRDGDFLRGLAHAFATGASFGQGDTRWVIESESDTPLVVPAASPVRLSSAEQSNSSVIIGAEAVLKLFRKLQPGVQPDVEVTRFLTVERRFLHVPVLLGTIHLSDRDGVAVAGMLQELVPGAMDGWTYALECSHSYFTAREGVEPALPFEGEARQLGAVTRGLHDALASGDPGSDFDLRAAARADVGRWARGASRTVEQACDAVQRALDDGRMPSDRVQEARAIVERRPTFLTRLEQLASDVDGDAGANTRTHGDFHLGQVLRSSAEQFLVIDFEGEPARPLAERRARNSPLRDVAGMLRSFAYASAVASGAGTDERPEAGPQPVVESRARRFEQRARDAFLQGYFGESSGSAHLLPRSASNAGRLIALFETEKVFYELHYELDHRPDWAWIPLRGIAQLFA